MEPKFYKWFSIIYTIVIFIFLYLPIAVVVAYSFNLSKINVVWTGFTLQWYQALITDSDLLAALQNSLIIASASTIIAIVLGTISAIGMYRYHFKGKSVINGLLYIPIVIPEIIMAISLLGFFALLNIPFGILTLILSHATFCIPLVLIVVKARLAGFDRSLEEAALDLGADRLKVFMTITVPLLLPGIISGALLAFASSLDDVIINFFVSGPENTTLPLKIFSMLRFGLSPEINALCTLMLAVIIAILGFIYLIMSKRSSRTSNNPMINVIGK
jgi:spermidine/putrescine transport system permease protein